MSETLREGVERLLGSFYWERETRPESQQTAEWLGTLVGRIESDLRALLAATAPPPDEVGLVEACHDGSRRMSETLREGVERLAAGWDLTEFPDEPTANIMRFDLRALLAAAALTPDDLCVHCGTVSALVTCPVHGRATAPTPDEVGLVERPLRLPCAGCGGPTRRMRSHVGAGLVTCDRANCGGNLTHLEGQAMTAPTPDEVGVVEGVKRLLTDVTTSSWMNHTPRVWIERRLTALLATPDEALSADDERLLAAEHDEPREQARAAMGRHPHLERLRALSRAAAPGPWEQERYRDGEMLPDGTGHQDDHETLGSTIVAWGEEIPHGNGERYALMEADAGSPADAEFIVAAVAYVRRLLGESGGEVDRPPVTPEEEVEPVGIAWVDEETHRTCPARRASDGALIECTITDPDHRHVDARLVDWMPLGEDVTLHTMRMAAVPHDDGRTCLWHHRLQAHVFGRPTDKRCLREHVERG